MPLPAADAPQFAGVKVKVKVKVGELVEEGTPGCYCCCCCPTRHPAIMNGPRSRRGWDVEDLSWKKNSYLEFNFS